MNRLTSRFVATLAVAALVPMVACGSDDDTGAASDGGADGSPTSSLDSGSGLDATTGDGGATLDSGITADGSSDAAVADGSASDADAASSPCAPINGTYRLVGPGTGSAALCPAETGIVCHFATDSGSCALTSQCSSPDGGVGTGFFAIPTGTLDGNDTLTYSASYPIPAVGDFTAACSLSFTDDLTVATLTCSGSVASFGSVFCSYSGSDAL